MRMVTYLVLYRLFLRSLLGFIFLYTGASKLAHPYIFRKGILDYKLIPSKFESALHISIVLAFIIPILEFLAGMCFLSGLLLPLTSIMTTLLLLAFTCAILINLLRGRNDLSCHCSGEAQDAYISWWLIMRNCLLLVGPISLLVLISDPFTLDAFIRHSFSFNASLLFSFVFPAVLSAIAVLGMYILLNAARVLWRN